MDAEIEYNIGDLIQAGAPESWEIIGDSISLTHPSTLDSCSICYIPNTHLLPCSCSILYCEPCLSEYFLSKLLQFDCNNILCPNQTCNKSSVKLAKKVLSAKDYKKLRKFSRNLKNLSDPKVTFCTRPDCEGVSEINRKFYLCSECRCEFIDTVDPGRLEILQKFDVVQCPKCSLLITKSFGCILTRCLCGFEFCAKCGKEISEEHSEWKCALGTRAGQISWIFLLLLLYFPVVLPFSPLIFVMGYHYHWDENYFVVIKERPTFYFLMIGIFSPMIFVFGLFLLPMWFGGLCVDVMFGERSFRREGIWLLGVKIVLFLPSVMLNFLGLLLLTGLVVVFSPIVGLVLLVIKLSDTK